MFKNKKTYQIVLAVAVLVLIAFPFSYKAIAATGLSVGSSTLSGTDDVIYGHGGNSTGSLLNLVNNSGSSFVVDSTGSLNISGAITAGSFNGTLSAADIGAGTFGSNIGVGNYNFNGNLGIGSASPAYKLDVAGTGSFTGTLLVGTPTANSHATTKSYVDSAVSSGVSGGISGTTNYLSKFTSPSTIGNSAIFETGGNVGIGTTNPTQKLELSIGSGDGISLGLRTGVSTNYYIGRVHESSEFGAESAWINFGADASNNNFLAFSTSRYGQEGGERMRIDPAGNVGIGTTAPRSGLDIAGDNAYVLVGNGTYTSHTVLGNKQLNGSGANDYQTYLADNAYWNPVSLSWNSVRDTLGVRAMFSMGYMQNAFAWNYQAATGATVTWSELMRLSYGGNLGIGTTAPAYKLDVAGTGQFTGTLLVGTPTASGHAATKSYVDSAITSGNADTVDGVHAASFLRSDANDTFTATSLTLDSGAYLNTRLIGSLGTELGIGAGEMWSTMNGSISGEYVWLGGESGVKVVSSPDNMSSGWAGRHEATLIDTAGNSTFPGTLTIGTPTSNAHAATKSYVDSVAGSSSPWTVSGGNIYPSNLTNLVGIGLSNPSSALEVGGTVRLRAGSPDIGIRGTDPNSTGHGVKIYDETDNLEIHFGHNSSTDENYLWDWDGAELKIGVSNAEVARFNASGLEVDTLQAQTSTDLNIDASGGTGNVVITIGN